MCIQLLVLVLKRPIKSEGEEYKINRERYDELLSLPLGWWAKKDGENPIYFLHTLILD